MAKKTGSGSAGNKTENKKKKGESKQAGSKRNGKSPSAALGKAIALVDVADTLTAPMTRSIENLLRIAAQSMGCDEASVLVRDGHKGGLKFMVSIGQVAEKLLKVRIPPGKGIAGFVFSSGQPVAIADVAQDDTFYSKVDEATGYSTQTILATPLRTGGDVIGVLEFVNRIGEPPYESFTPDEMDNAAHFADAIATLVDAHESASLIELLFQRTVAGPAEKGGKSSGNEMREWLKRVRAAPEHKDLLTMAVSLREIASRGDANAQCAGMCLTRFLDGLQANRLQTPGSSVFSEDSFSLAPIQVVLPLVKRET